MFGFSEDAFPCHDLELVPDMVPLVLQVVFGWNLLMVQKSGETN